MGLPNTKPNLPETAKKVFEGVLFDVYQWPQELYDGTIVTFERLTRKPCVCIIAVTEEGQFITLMQEQPHKPLFPSLPGGQVDEGETFEEAAIRELREETGYEAKEWELFAHYEGMHKIQFPEEIFIARGCTKVGAQALDGGEKITVQLSSFEELLNLARNPHFSLPLETHFLLYEALVDPVLREQLRKQFLGIV